MTAPKHILRLLELITVLRTGKRLQADDGSPDCEWRAMIAEHVRAVHRLYAI
jgi:hypothetical protein